MLNSNVNKNRIIEIDFLRGFALIFMFFDHLMYDFLFLLPSLFPSFPKKDSFFEDIYFFSSIYWDSLLRITFRYFIIFLFLAIAGICSSFSLNNLKRGAKLMIVSILLTFVTFILGISIFSLDFMITWGIIHTISLSLIVIGILQKFLDNKYIFLLIGSLMIILGIYFEINQVYVSYYDENIFLIIFNQISGKVVAGSDSFSFLLYGGQIFIGYFLGKLLYKQKTSLFSKMTYKKNIITFNGKNSLVVYLAHQIVLSLILIIFLFLFGYRLVL